MLLGPGTDRAESRGMIHAIAAFLKKEPFILLFLVVAAGYLFSRVKLKGFGLGIVASTLIVGMLLSLAAFKGANVSFSLPAILQTLFFNLYIFCVGLRVGPQCFAGLEKSGRQFLMTGVIAIVVTPILAAFCGWVFHLDAGTLAGVISGANTASAAFGSAQSVASGAEASNLSVAFALSYAFSLVGFVLILPYFSKLGGGDPRAAALQMEKETSAGKAALPQTEGALSGIYASPIDIRAYRLQNPRVEGKTVGSLAKVYPLVTVEKVRRDGRLLPVSNTLVLSVGDEIALGAPLDAQLRGETEVGPEIDAPDLREVVPEAADIVITRSELSGRTLRELQMGVGHGLYFQAAFRMGEEIPLGPQTHFKQHDVLRVIGSKGHVDALAQAAGVAVTSSVSTDLLTVSLGLLMGGLLGAITIPLGAIHLGIGTAAGLLIVSVLLSWFRTRYPEFGGPFPEPARMLMEDLGLSVFIATVGLNAGPGLVQALGAGTVGPILATCLVLGFVPPLAVWYYGTRVMKLNSALLLGAVAGARQSSPGLKVAQDTVQSTVPAIGFPVPFTLTTLVFTFYGYLAMVLWPIH